MTECATDFYVRLRSINTEKDQKRKVRESAYVTACAGDDRDVARDYHMGTVFVRKSG